MIPIASDLTRALGAHLWESTLVAAATLGLYALLRGHGAQVRCAILAAASAKFLLPFALLAAVGAALPWPPPRVVTVPAAVSAEPGDLPLTAAALGDGSTVGRGRGAQDRGVSAGGMLLAAWIAGSLVVLVRRSAAMRPAVAARRRARPAEDRRVAGAFARAGGPAAGVVLRTSSDCGSPGVIGIVRPVLLWPEGMGARLTDAQLEAVMAHEIAHVRRRDNLVAAVQAVVEILFWFHPLVWWIGTRLADEREHACDEAVLAAGAAPDVYADGILKVCECSLGAPAVGVAGISGSTLTQRIEAIMTAHTPRPLGWLPRTLVALGIATLVMVPVAAGAMNKQVVQTMPGPAVALDKARPSMPPAPIPPAADTPPVATRPAIPSQVSQAETGSVAGVVTDQMGGVVSGAKVVVRSSAQAAAFEGVSDEQGRYLIAGVRPGSYELRVTYPAFRTFTQRVTVAAGREALAHATLQIGAISESVTIGALLNDAASPTDPASPAQEAQLLQQIEAAPDDPSGHLALASFYYRQERYDESAAAMRRAADLIGQRETARSSTYRVTLPSGGNVREPRKIRDVKPIYPEIARTAKVSGIVILEATIAEDGTVRDIHVLRSVPLLDAAAVGAVRQWLFTPTLLNGAPVEVVITTTISFTLRDAGGR